MPAISVIVPVYNVERYLPLCIDSIRNQTFKDIEIICVDDGSTDGSEAILRLYEKVEPRLHIVCKE
ncbi:MAG: glycosyltransferase family 2 protein, partial [Eggerthellaceae bacterium]|nr:glycosyltransferase family 2 protein [Eggerthellaceae bacterium]